MMGIQKYGAGTGENEQANASNNESTSSETQRSSQGSAALKNLKRAPCEDNHIRSVESQARKPSVGKNLIER